jgi:hypothetical protein
MGLAQRPRLNFFKFVPFPILNFLCSKATHMGKKKQGQKWNKQMLKCVFVTQVHNNPPHFTNTRMPRYTEKHASMWYPLEVLTTLRTNK